jgi:hypothetical protein
MRCYFHLQSGSDIILDDKGIEFEDADQLRAEVLRALTEFEEELPELMADIGDWNLSVCSASGTLLFSLLLRDTSS